MTYKFFFFQNLISFFGGEIGEIEAIAVPCPPMNPSLRVVLHVH
jgi:hypothetical protein